MKTAEPARTSNGLGNIITHAVSRRLKERMTFFAKLFRNTGIQNRLLVSFLVLSVIPLLITGIYFYNKSNKAIQSKISTYSIQIMHQINKEVERDISDLMDLSENMVSSDYIQENLSEYEKADDNRKMLISNNIINYLTTQFPIISSISDIRVLTSTDSLIYYQRMYVMLSESMERLKKIAVENEGIPGYAPVKLESNKKGVALAREIYSVKSFEPMGYLFLTVVEDSISDIYRDIYLGEGAEIFILDSDGIVVSSRNPQIEIGKPLTDSLLITSIRENQNRNRDTFTYFLNGRETLTTYSYTKKADWYVVCSIPFSYLNSESAKMGSYIILIGTVCLLFAVVLAVIITRSISLPLKRLIRHMDEAKKGNLDMVMEESSRDEIGEVTLNFKNTLDEIKNLIANVQESERQKSAEKLRVLQAQINPHFLSNTLNTVKWLATVQNADNISNLVTSLIQLMQVSMGRGDELITLVTEIDYIKNYITIQEYKYCDKFNVQYDIEDEILKCMIPKFTLQPIVENAIIHGIEPMEGHGSIVIKGGKSEGDIVLTVTDNGVGFSQNELERFALGASPAARKQFSGMGVKNVDERLKLLFGEKYGITIESIPNMYSKVKVKIPEVYDSL